MENFVYSAAHEPYGGIQRTWVGTYDPEIKFSGQPHDSWSELDYFGARYYDRTQYRFISVDPIIPTFAALGDPQQWNLYSYCRSNPVNYIDPDGRQTLEITRYRYNSDATYGNYKLILGDTVISGYTLEPAIGVGKGPIPTGDYEAKSLWWSANRYQVYWLQDVPGFKGIFIHRGNSPGETVGCILVGKKLVSGGIRGSKTAMNELVFEIADYFADLMIGEIVNGLDDLDFMSYLLSGIIRVQIMNAPLPQGVVTYSVVVRPPQ